MSQSMVRLGSATLTLPKDRASLVVESSAVLRSAGSFSTPPLLESHTLISPNVWITRGHAFHFSFTVSWDRRNLVPQMAKADFLNYFGRALKGAQVRLWLFTSSAIPARSSFTVIETAWA